MNEFLIEDSSIARDIERLDSGHTCTILEIDQALAKITVNTRLSVAAPKYFLVLDSLSALTDMSKR